MQVWLCGDVILPLFIDRCIVDVITSKNFHDDYKKNLSTVLDSLSDPRDLEFWNGMFSEGGQLSCVSSMLAAIEAVKSDIDMTCAFPAEPWLGVHVALIQYVLHTCVDGYQSTQARKVLNAELKKRKLKEAVECFAMLSECMVLRVWNMIGFYMMLVSIVYIDDSCLQDRFRHQARGSFLLPTLIRRRQHCLAVSIIG